MKRPTPAYDRARKNKATTRALLRLLVSGYLLYLVWQIVAPTFSGKSDISLPIALVIGGVFTAAVVAFGVYTWKQYRIGLKEAELTLEELEEQAADNTETEAQDD